MNELEYEVHPIAELLPPMAEDVFQDFKADVATHGQKDPATIWQGKLIDGRHRARACKELGLKLIVTELADDQDPLQYSLSRNLYRRHLTPSERAVIAAKMATMKRGRPSEENGSIDLLSAEKAASMLSVSVPSVKRAKQVLEHGSKEVIDAVERGELPVSLAAKFVTEESDKREQSKIVRQGRDAVKKHITSVDYVEQPEPKKVVEIDADEQEEPDEPTPITRSERCRSRKHLERFLINSRLEEKVRFGELISKLPRPLKGSRYTNLFKLIREEAKAAKEDLKQRSTN